VTADAGSIPDRTIEAALPRVAGDYAALIENSPKGPPAPDPKLVVAHYAAVQVVFAHLLELSAVARSRADAGADVTDSAEAACDSALREARAGMAEEDNATKEAGG
jgi:hypothetical protein